MKPTDLPLIRVPGRPSVSPDGSFAVVAVSRADLDADDYTGQLWFVPTGEGGQPRQLTHGWRDASPQISPDGRWVAFTRVTRSGAGSHASGVPGQGKAEFGDRPQLCVLPLDGGEPIRLTDHPLGVGAPEWSPDSTRLAYAARVPAPGRYRTAKDADGETIPADGEPPRRITRMLYRLDDIGFVYDRPKHVFVIERDGGQPHQVTDGDFEHGDPSWSPDGQWLTFAGARHETAGDDTAIDVWVARPDGSGARCLTDTTIAAAQPLFSPDGALVVFTASPTGAERMDVVMRNEVLYAVPFEGGSAKPILDPEWMNLGMPGGEIAMTATGALFPNEHRGGVQLLRVPLGGGEPDVVIDGPRQATSACEGGGVLVATVAAPDTWGDLFIGERRLTDFSAPYRAAVSVFEPAEIVATAPDGTSVHGWVVRPAGAGPHPVLLMIHGGPYTQYGWRLFDEAQVYAAAGYAVVMGNPRGSSGYGLAHGRAVMGNVGEQSAVDLLALLDAALAAPDLDGSRVGVLGGSHGGFMTTWLAAHHGDRFRAAISERAVNAIDSFTGSSDVGWFFADVLYGPTPEAVARQSPLTYADRINIPMLIIHSEHDWRCPVEQAQRLFVALKRRGAQVEMLLFPGEGHELSRSGRPSHRVARFEAILEWFGRWM